MNITIKELENDADQMYEVRNFIFNQIEKEFGYRYVPEYHKDIVDLAGYYIGPEKNTFFVAYDKNTNEIIATIGLRAYDKDFKEFENKYSSKTTASIWRLFVDERYRRCGLATLMVNLVEDYSYKKGYDEIYLHTHKTLDGALEFWMKMGFKITIDTDNELKTVHMDKKLSALKLDGQFAFNQNAIKL